MVENTAPRLSLFLVDFFETQELRRSPHGLKVLSDSSMQKIPAKKSPPWKGVFMFTAVLPPKTTFTRTRQWWQDGRHL